MIRKTTALTCWLSEKWRIPPRVSAGKDHIWQNWPIQGEGKRARTRNWLPSLLHTTNSNKGSTFVQT